MEQEELIEAIEAIIPIIIGLIVLIGIFTVLSKGGKKTKEDTDKELSPEDEIRKLQKQPLSKRYKRG